ncbi:MFS transporter [Sphingomonas sp. DT-204]|uniref:MFS transporter n=1 Tax=Sphingomonas sp. DT-204 TaxID=3396166 RepID=UPI003F1C5FC0
MGEAEGSKRPWSGLPRGFLPLALTEYWERLSLAGLKSLLTLVLIDHILAQDRANVAGAGAIERTLETLFGPLSTIGLASQIYGLTNALLYLSIPLGGLLGDRISGRRGAVYIGGGAMFVALALMIGERYFLLALPLFAFGAGTIKGNLSVVVGRLFVDDAERRRGFAVYLGFLNAGVICGPLLCGALALWGGWRFGLGAAAAAIALGVVGFHIAMTRSLPAITAAVPASGNPGTQEKTEGDIVLIVATLLALYLCFAAYEQVGNIFLVWARARAALDFPVAWLVSLDGLFTLALIPLSQLGLKLLARRGIAIGAPAQIALGCCACVLGNLVLAAADWIYGDQVPLAAPLAYLLLVDFAIVLTWPAGLSLIMDAAPARLTGFWVGLFYLHGFFANLWVGFGGALYERMAPASFWSLHAALAAAGALVAAASGALRTRDRLPQAAITTSA